MPEGEKIERTENTAGKNKINNPKKLTTIYLKSDVKILTVIYQNYIWGWYM